MGVGDTDEGSEHLRTAPRLAPGIPRRVHRDGNRSTVGFRPGKATDPKIQQSVDRAETYLFEKLERVRRADATAIYNVWTHIYAIQALARMSQEKPDDKVRQERIKDLIANQLDRLRRYESVDGGWGYYDFRYGTKRPSSSSTSFVSAAGLVAFYDAEASRVRDAGGHHQARDRLDPAAAKSDNTYVYAEPHKMRPMGSINRARRAASGARSHAISRCASTATRRSRMRCSSNGSTA